MSDVQKTDQPPTCPLCAGATELKQVLWRENELHYFFRCIACTVVHPVIKLINPGGPAAV